jgi:hypothetical protein
MEQSGELESVWVFKGSLAGHPSAVFRTRERAEEWISHQKLTGTLTKYPLDLPIYTWAVEKGHFVPKRDDQRTSEFIAGFSSASQEHYHYEDGVN